MSPLCLTQHSNHHYLLNQRIWPRARHGMHHKKATGIRLYGADVATANSGSPENENCQKPKTIQCESSPDFLALHSQIASQLLTLLQECPFLDLHDPWPGDGKLTPFAPGSIKLITIIDVCIVRTCIVVSCCIWLQGIWTVQSFREFSVKGISSWHTLFDPL